MPPGKTTHPTFDRVKMCTSGQDFARIVKRSGANEPHLAPAVLAKDGDLTPRTAMDALDAAVVARDVDAARRSRQDLHASCLDEEVDNEGAARLALTIQTVAAVHEQRIASDEKAAAILAGSDRLPLCSRSERDGRRAA